MYKRVRYKTEGGLVKSTRMLLGANGATYGVTIDTASNTYSITDSNNAEVFRGASTSLAKAKNTVKAALSGLGVVFDKESRNRQSLGV